MFSPSLPGFSPGSPAASHRLKNMWRQFETLNFSAGVNVSVNGFLSLCGPVMSWKLVQRVTLPSPNGSLDRLQSTPVTLNSASGYRKWMNIRVFFFSSFLFFKLHFLDFKASFGVSRLLNKILWILHYTLGCIYCLWLFHPVSSVRAPGFKGPCLELK